VTAGNRYYTYLAAGGDVWTHAFAAAVVLADGDSSRFRRESVKDVVRARWGFCGAAGSTVARLRNRTGFTPHAEGSAAEFRSEIFSYLRKTEPSKEARFRQAKGRLERHCHRHA